MTLSALKGIGELNVLDLSSKHHRVLVVYQTKDRAGTLEAVGRGGLLRSRHYSRLCCEGWVQSLHKIVTYKGTYSVQ